MAFRSMVPWPEFTGFNINVFVEGKFLLPIFTMGKYLERDGKRFLPLAIQAHHAVCDGEHVGMFVETCRNLSIALTLQKALWRIEI